MAQMVKRFGRYGQYPAFQTGPSAQRTGAVTRSRRAIGTAVDDLDFALVRLTGVIDNRSVRSPLVALDEDEVEALRVGLVAAGLL